jgi:hypothetical protein
MSTQITSITELEKKLVYCNNTPNFKEPIELITFYYDSLDSHTILTIEIKISDIKQGYYINLCAQTDFKIEPCAFYQDAFIGLNDFENKNNLNHMISAINIAKSNALNIAVLSNSSIYSVFSPVSVFTFSDLTKALAESRLHLVKLEDIK